MDIQPPDAPGSRIRRQPTLLPGRPVPADRLYIARNACGGFFNSMAWALYALYVVRDAHLSPFELVIVGTVLEASAFLFEIPTGVVADVVSRRLSVLIGTVVSGLAPVAIGLFPSFEGVIAGQFLLGLGFTFISGANEAWLADEIGEDAAARIYPRAVQWRLGAGVAGVVAAAGLGLLDHGLPFIVGGAAYALMALPLAMTMTEAGFRPAPRGERTSWRHMHDTARTGFAEARRRPMVRAALAVAFFLGFSSEAFDRLWSYHLIENIGLPAGIDEVLLFGGIVLATQLGGLLAVRLARGATADGTRASAARLLTGLYAGIAVGVLVLAFAGLFWVGVALVVIVGWLRTAEAPFFTAWVNRGLSAATRATVLSSVSQGNAIGQVASGPFFAGVAGAFSARAALALGAAIVLPAIAFVRAKPVDEHATVSPAAQEIEVKR